MIESEKYVIKADIQYLKTALDTLEEELLNQPDFFRLVDDIASRREPKIKLIVPAKHRIDDNEILIRRRQYFSKQLGEDVDDYIEVNSIGEIEYVDCIDRFEIVYEPPPVVHSSGAGMSGGVGKNFVQRLHQLGITVSNTGERLAYRVKPGDLCVYFSGGWKTLSTTNYAKEARKGGATVVAITSYPDIAISKENGCHYAIGISGREAILEDRDYYLDQVRGKTSTSVDPMGTMYEFKADVFRLVLVHYVSDKLKETEETMRKRHVMFE